MCVSGNLLPQSLSKIKSIKSTKLGVAIEYINCFVKEGRKTIVFSQFVGALKEMELLLQSLGIKYVTLYGDTKDRRASVDSIQNNSLIGVILISLRAGGVGLNITAAERIILLDDWWNPSVEAQAIARAYRIGQKKRVEVFRLVCSGTVEEKILLLQAKKKETIDLFNSANDKITIEELKGLLS